MNTWSWDPTLFAGTAAHYRRGRLPYADSLVDWMRELLAERELQGTGALLDVGCGPGTLTLPLSVLFPRTVGVDPDPGMIELAMTELARREATGADVEFRCERAEEMRLEPAGFAVATFGQSFHWMDRAQVAAALRRALVPGGVFALVSDRKGQPDPDAPSGERPAPPKRAITALLAQWLGPDRRAGQSSLPTGTASGEEEIIARAGFVGPERVLLGGGEVVTRSVDDLVASVFSRSDGAPHLFGDRCGEFEAELRELLASASVDGHFDEVVPATEVRYWLNPSR